MSASVHPIGPRAAGLAAELHAIHLRLAPLTDAPAPDVHALGDLPAWALDELSARLGLSPFERAVVLFAAAAELVGATRALLGPLGGGMPSLGLALRACGGCGGDWAALRPNGVLRRARILAVADEGPASERAIYLEEPVLHFLHGTPQLDRRLNDIALPARAEDAADAPGEAVALLGRREARGLPLLELVADDPAHGADAAAAALAAAGYSALTIPTSRLPREPAALAALRGAWARDALLHDLGLVLIADGPPGETATLVTGFMSPVILVTAAPLPVSLAPSVRIALPPAAEDQRAAWARALGPVAAARLAGEIDALSGRLALPHARLRAVADAHRDSPPGALAAAARADARPDGEPFLERIPPRAKLTDLVLPDAARATVAAVIAAARGRERVANEWGFGEQSARGLGIAALFAGESGTGKTMAAEAIASELGVDLYKVEVSAVVSKYIGETEKHLRRVFAAAERCECVLLFDEADTLLGRRSEVRDAHDRYANLEVGYLLQLMESYRGLAVLTTNMPEALDPAFMRRLRFVVRFPLPGPDERRRMWERAFPAAAPVESIDPVRLSRLALSGGLIRNIALGAALRAADEARPITTADIAAAARAEFEKIDRPLSELDGRAFG